VRKLPDQLTWNPILQVWEVADLLEQREPFLATFPKEGTMQDGVLWPHQKPAQRIVGSESLSLLPTPNASDGSGGGQHPDKRKGHSRQLIDYALLCTPTAVPFTSRSGDRYGEKGLRCQAAEMATDWGKYEEAIVLWQNVTGRKAPAPTEPSRNNRPRMAATFPEWLMGWPEGWVTNPEIGLSRAAQLKVIGNGVVPQQAVAALRKLLED
jgi:hypothetical protein